MAERKDYLRSVMEATPANDGGSATSKIDALLLTAATIAFAVSENGESAQAPLIMEAAEAMRDILRETFDI